MRASLFLAPLAALFLAACGDSGYESSVGQRLALKDSDVSGTTLAREKDVSALFDDQWHPFLERAEEQLGHAPESVELRGASFQLDAANSKNVGRLEEALVGEVVLYLKDPGTGVITDVAKVKDPKGTGRCRLALRAAGCAVRALPLQRPLHRAGARGDSRPWPCTVSTPAVGRCSSPSRS